MNPVYLCTLLLSLQHYYVNITYQYACYHYIIITCYYCNNGSLSPVIAVIMDPLLQ